MDIEEIIANLRYDYIVEIKSKSIKIKSVKIYGGIYYA